MFQWIKSLFKPKPDTPKAKRKSPVPHLVKGYHYTKNGKTIYVSDYWQGAKDDKPTE